MSKLTHFALVPGKSPIEKDEDYAKLLLKKGSKQSCDLREASVFNNKVSIENKIEVAIAVLFMGFDVFFTVRDFSCKSGYF